MFTACQTETNATDTALNSPVFATSTTFYGQLADGSQIDKVTLYHPEGMEVDVINYGGIITRFTTPDKQNKLGDIVLGFDNLNDYVTASPYFGAIVGRYANRIASGKFTLNKVEYRLAQNNGENHIHGGKQGFDKKVWAMVPFTTDTSAGVVLTLQSPDGDQGYPGTLDVEVIYELTAENLLDIRFKAKTSKPTIVNLTQHSYFNLAGSGDVLNHQLQINSQAITPVNQHLIPSGELMPVKGTPFDFTSPKTIGQDINANHTQLKHGNGYDHNYIIKSAVTQKLILAATVSEPISGRILQVWSEEPAIQFYSGNWLNSSLQGKGRTYGPRSGFCLEPQHTPDSPNQAQFPSTVLDPDDTYQTRIQYKFFVEKLE